MCDDVEDYPGYSQTGERIKPSARPTTRSVYPIIITHHIFSASSNCDVGRLI